MISFVLKSKQKKLFHIESLSPAKWWLICFPLQQKSTTKLSILTLCLPLLPWSLRYTLVNLLLWLLHWNHFQEMSQVKVNSGFHTGPRDSWLFHPLWATVVTCLLLHSSLLLRGNLQLHDLLIWITPGLCSPVLSPYMYCFGKLIHFHVIKCQIHSSQRLILLTPDSDIQFLTIIATHVSNRCLTLSMSKTKLLFPQPSSPQLIAIPLASCSGEKHDIIIDPSLSFLPFPSNPWGNAAGPAFRSVIQPLLTTVSESPVIMPSLNYCNNFLISFFTSTVVHLHSPSREIL